jgi:multimeric flavodoxin WrbA
MSAQKVFVLHGATNGEPSLASALSILTDVLRQNGAEVRTFSRDSLRLTHCIGCFGCWLETPGICRFKEPGAQEFLETLIPSDTVILLTPVTFGGYSSEVKQVVDRMLPILLPYMSTYHGEVHHKPRYSRRPRLIGIGLQDRPNRAEAGTFRLLVGRHAVDVHAPSYAAEVVGVNDSAESLRSVFQSLLTRNDVLPRGRSINRLMPYGEMAVAPSDPNRRRDVLLIVGSPKTRSASSSSVLGNYLLDRLKEHGWETESLTLKTSTFTGEGEAALLAAVDRADMLIFAFPLYVDALPALMTRALERVARRRRSNAQQRPLSLFAIVNNGFPESYQSNLALLICRNFAVSTGMTWLGALAIGGGEAVIGGKPIQARNDLGFPMFKITNGLALAADALAQGQPVPADAILNLSSSPIPFAPYRVWRYLFLRNTASFWEKRASEFGVGKKSVLARPFSVDGGS